LCLYLDHYHRNIITGESSALLHLPFYPNRVKTLRSLLGVVFNAVLVYYTPILIATLPTYNALCGS